MAAFETPSAAAAAFSDKVAGTGSTATARPPGMASDQRLEHLAGLDARSSGQLGDGLGAERLIALVVVVSQDRVGYVCGQQCRDRRGRRTCHRANASAGRWAPSAAGGELAASSRC